MLSECEVVGVCDGETQAEGQLASAMCHHLLVVFHHPAPRTLGESVVFVKHRPKQTTTPKMNTYARFAFRLFSDRFPSETWCDFIVQIYCQMSRGQLNSLISNWNKELSLATEFFVESISLTFCGVIFECTSQRIIEPKKTSHLNRHGK